MASPRQTTAPTSLPRKGGSPGMLILLGMFILGFALLIVTLQTQTNEAYVSHTQQKDEVIQAQWSIWLQIPRLMFGGSDIKSSDLPGVIIGQGIELSYVALITGLEIAIHTSRKYGRLIGALIIILLFLIAIFDFNADLVYGNVSSEAHVIFAVFCTLVVGFFPRWGLSLIESGWKRL